MKKRLFLVKSDNYSTSTLRALKPYLQNNKSCYLTLNKTERSIEEAMQSENIDYTKVHFIDAVTPRLFKNELADRCTPVQNIEDLNLLAETIITTVRVRKSTMLVIDSISSFLVYSTEKDITKFLQYIVAFLERMQVDLFIISLDEDKDQSLVKQISMMVDERTLVK